MDREAIKKEMGQLRWRLLELDEMLQSPGVRPIVSKEGTARISVGVTLAEYKEITELARHSSTSVSALGQLALRHLLVQARAGALPMVPVSRVETAETVTCLGNPIPNYPA